VSRLRRAFLASVTVVATVLAAAATALVSPGPAGAAPAPTGQASAGTAAVLQPTDFCLEQCHDILPPGQNGNASLVAIIAHQVLGVRPAHSADQLDEYANLVAGYTGLTEGQLDRFYNRAAFGVPAGEAESSYQPRADVTIVRDRATGVPHITGTTRAGTMFGAGYAGAEDRLWLMDLLRHLGRGQLSSFAGGAPGNRELEQSVWRNSPYTDADLQAQVDRIPQLGPRGQQFHADGLDYVAGVNAYIARCQSRLDCPGEYVLTGQALRPFVPADLIAIAGVVGGLFGGGGGAELRSALARVVARVRFGPEQGDRIWAAFRSQNDPETVLTVHDGQSFPYGQAPASAPGVALPDPGSVVPQPVAFDQAGGATNATGNPGPLAGLRVGADRRTHGMSNAVVISAAHSATGHPIAVFGPQTGYFAPQLLMLQELQGPGISARGVAFAGLNMYVLIGRGRDYACSATSAGQDITDTFATPLCTVDGSAPTVNSDRYLFRGQCLQMETIERRNSWVPTLADGTPAGSYRLAALRTKYGLVAARGTVAGRPVAFTSLRSTYRHEAESAIGFQTFDDPSAMASAQDFKAAAANIGYAFNWFYVNAAEAAYFNSGSNPVRAAGADPNLPNHADPAYEWQGWNPDANTADYTPASNHPQSVNQDYYVSWNNKQARDYSAADGNFSFGAVHRGDLLDRPVRAAIAAGRKLGRADVVKLVEEAALTDLRGREVLGELLTVIGPSTDNSVAKLRAWYDSGAKRVETAPGSHVYQHADAVRIMDAWWSRLVQAQFGPGLGPEVFAAMAGALQLDEAPSQVQHRGSAFQSGWFGYVDKDLRAVLGQPVQGGLDRTYCGGGVLAACRQVLLTTLTAAAAAPAAETYPGDGGCAAGDQWCADSIVQSPLGGITHERIAWQNRPTYQQVVSFPARRGDDITNLAQGRAASASSTFLFDAPRRAVDGDPTTRWSSWFSDDQWLAVDLGGPRAIGRVVLRWGVEYGLAYRIEVSDDNRVWRAVAVEGAGDGGRDVVAFPITTARYVRMHGVDRASILGYALFEFEVYGR
jgi:acyl-homoserine lactone acylase PvdQ